MTLVTGIRKQLCAVGLCAVMLLGDTLPTLASVSSGDAATVGQETSGTVSGNDLEGTVSGGDLEEVVLTTQVSGVTITLTAPAGAVPEGTQLWAEEIRQSEKLDVIDQALETEAEKKDVEVCQYKAFDIRLLADGQEIQPAEGVKVTFAGDILLPADELESVTVYHVTDNAQASDMAAVVTQENAVEMETTHFSTYVIVVEGVTDTRKITFNHYLGTPESRTRIYAPSRIAVDNTQYMYSELPVQGGDNYRLTQVVVTSGSSTQVYVNDQTDSSKTEIRLNALDNVIDLYYEEVEQTYANGVTFFDYYIDNAEETASMRIVPIYNWSCIGTTFTINDESTVYGENSVFHCHDENDPEGNLDLKLPGGWEVIENRILKDGDLIHLTNGDVWTYRASTRRFYYEVTERASFNAGINAGADESKPFLSMGTSNNVTEGHDGHGESWDVTGYSRYTVTKNGQKLNINTNNAWEIAGGSTTDGTYAIVPGLVERLDDPNGNGSYTQLVMGKTDDGQQIQEPGYFDNTTSDSKAIYENYSLHFNQTGNTYVLDYAQNDESGRKTYAHTDDGSLSNYFFPLSDVEPIGGRDYYQPEWWTPLDNNIYNQYFGMRYDFTFSIGDYVGTMEYSFSGDDDLWVFVDGKPVLDLGGIHSAYPNRYEVCPDANSVDLWNALFGFTDEDQRLNLTDAQKQAVHTVSILFMERGGEESSCDMKFVIPNVEAKVPVISNVPRADLPLVKKDSVTGAAIAGVGFTLYSDAACTTSVNGERFTDASGRVLFTGLGVGTYYLKETAFNREAYEENATVYEVRVTRNQDSAAASVDGLAQENGSYVVYNTPVKTTDLEFVKVNRWTHERLGGVKFYLRENNASGRVLMTAVTAEDGSFRFANIRAGVYYLEEDPDTVPEGYRKPDRGWTIEVKEVDGQLTYDAISEPGGLWWKDCWDENHANLVKNEPYVSFTFTKKDASTGLGMSGVEFRVYKGNNDRRSELVATAQSDADGVVKFEGLVVGQAYLLVETTPDGYLETDPWVIRIDYENNRYVEKIFDTVYDQASNEWKYDDKTPYAENVIENVPAVGSLVITKQIDGLNRAYGDASFTFRIENTDGEVWYRTISFTDENVLSRSLTVENLPVGEYTVTELDQLRYTQQQVVVTAAETDGSNTARVTLEDVPVFGFVNVQKDDRYYSHSDLMVNSFRRSGDGTIEISREREVIGETDAE